MSRVPSTLFQCSLQTLNEKVVTVDWALRMTIAGKETISGLLIVVYEGQTT